jgi:hypothetical protein
MVKYDKRDAYQNLIFVFEVKITSVDNGGKDINFLKLYVPGVLIC